MPHAGRRRLLTLPLLLSPLLAREARGQCTDAGRVSAARPFEAWLRGSALWREHARRTGADDSLGRARDAAWMAYVRTFKDKNATRALLGLREVRSEDTPGWKQDALYILSRPIVTADMEGHSSSPASAPMAGAW